MEGKIGINIVIEREKYKNEVNFIASSPDVNVFAEGKTIDEAKKKFIGGLKIHLRNFPEGEPLRSKLRSILGKIN